MGRRSEKADWNRSLKIQPGYPLPSRIARIRRRLMEELGSLEGVTPCRSDANFILFRVAQATDVYEGLLQRGVLVRNMDGVVRGALRVTVGTPRENSLFLRALRGVLRKVRR
jgi:histidinol-phosphate aminotransferase